MKKLFVIITALSLMLTACKKEDNSFSPGRYSVAAVNPQTSSEVKHNLDVDQNEAAGYDMPKAAILKAFQMSESEFNTVWSEGKIEFGLIQTEEDGTPKVGQEIEWNKISGGFYIKEGGKICTVSDTSSAVLKIVQPADFWKMNVLGGKVYAEGMSSAACVGTKFFFEQIFHYVSPDSVAVTFAVPWKLEIVKGDPRVKNSKTLETDTRSWSATYCSADSVNFVVINDSIAKDVIDAIKVDPMNSDAYVYLNGAPVYKEELGPDLKMHKVFVTGTDLWFRADGTNTKQSDGEAALHVFRTNENGQMLWKCTFTANENTEGTDISVQIAFVRDEEEAMLYPVKVENVARKFMNYVSSFSLSTGAVFQIKMLRTTNARVSSKFDFNAGLYDELNKKLKEMGQSWTLAELMNRGLALLYAPWQEKNESTIDPFGHWFSSNAEVKMSSSTDKFVGFALVPDDASGHCYITFEKAAGECPTDWQYDTKSFSQWFYVPAAQMSVPVTYVVTLVDEVK